MAQVRWTPQASDDLEAVCRFVARDSARLAGLTAARILRATKVLEETPVAGRVVPERERDDLRELIVAPYRIVYRLQTQACVIICVLHGKQEFPAGVSEDVATYQVDVTHDSLSEGLPHESFKHALLSMPNIGREAAFARRPDQGTQVRVVIGFDAVATD